MRTRPRSQPSSAPRARGNWLPLMTTSALCLLLSAGCIVSPAPSATATEAGPPFESDANARSKTSNPRVSPCVRVWSKAMADSVWDCPDPRPPAAVQGKSG